MVRLNGLRRFWRLIAPILTLAPVFLQLHSPLFLIGQDATAKASVAAFPPREDRRITLDVVVTDHSGKLISGLKQADFTILDNKQPQPIVSFSAVDSTHKAADPPRAVILLDSLNNSNERVALLRQQLRQFFQRNGEELPVQTFLAFLPDTAKDQPVPTRDGSALLQYLDSNTSGQSGLIRTQGYFGALDRVRASHRALGHLIDLEGSVPGRKLLIWLGNGWPTLGSEDNLNASYKDRAALFSYIVSLSSRLRRGRITVYNVGLDEDSHGEPDENSRESLDFYENFLRGVSSPKTVHNADVALDVLGIQSGGLVLRYDNDLVSSLRRCLNDAETYYTLSFEAPPAGHSDEYHGLRVKIHDPGLKARTRTGYYDQP